LKYKRKQFIPKKQVGIPSRITDAKPDLNRDSSCLLGYYDGLGAILSAQLAAGLKQPIHLSCNIEISENSDEFPQWQHFLLEQCLLFLRKRKKEIEEEEEKLKEQQAEAEERKVEKVADDETVAELLKKTTLAIVQAVVNGGG